MQDGPEETVRTGIFRIVHARLRQTGAGLVDWTFERAEPRSWNPGGGDGIPSRDRLSSRRARLRRGPDPVRGERACGDAAAAGPGARNGAKRHARELLPPMWNRPLLFAAGRMSGADRINFT
jgi:hypothetical protein